MAQAKSLLLCAVCTLACSYAQPAPGPAADAGSPSAAPAPGPTGSGAQTLPLTPFARVAVCTPFTVLVQPSSGYSVTIDADEALKGAITTLVDGDTLLLESNSFTTTKTIKVTVGLPASKLTTVTARGTFPVVVAPGFTSQKLTISTQGTSVLNVVGIDAASLSIMNSG